MNSNTTIHLSIKSLQCCKHKLLWNELTCSHRHKTHTSYIDTENGATYRRNQNFVKSRQVPFTSEKSDSLGWYSKKSYFPPETSAHDPVTPHQLSETIPDKPSLITVTSDKNDISVPEKSPSPAPLRVSSWSNNILIQCGFEEWWTFYHVTLSVKTELTRTVNIWSHIEFGNKLDIALYWDNT